jgi:hypothetical protein
VLPGVENFILVLLPPFSAQERWGKLPHVSLIDELYVIQRRVESSQRFFSG